MDWNTVEFVRDPPKAFQICILPNFIEYITQRLTDLSSNLLKANISIKRGERILLIAELYEDPVYIYLFIRSSSFCIPLWNT